MDTVDRYGGQEGSPAAVLKKPCSKYKICAASAKATQQMLYSRNKCKSCTANVKSVRKVQKLCGKYKICTANAKAEQLLKPLPVHLIKCCLT